MYALYVKARAYGAMQEKTPAGVDLLESLRLAAAADDDLSVVRTWGCRASQVHFCANRAVFCIPTQTRTPGPSVAEEVRWPQLSHAQANIPGEPILNRDVLKP